MTRIPGVSLFAAGAAALLIGCANGPTGPVVLEATYSASGFAGVVLEETPTQRVIGVSQRLELDGEGSAVRRTFARVVDKATLDETEVEYVIEMTYEVEGDRLRTSPVLCQTGSCPLSIQLDPPDYLIKDRGQTLIELTTPTERRTYLAVQITDVS